MEKTLKQKLDALKVTRQNDMWNRMVYPVQARAEFEVAERVANGEKLPFYACTDCIHLPADVYAKIIYVPKELAESNRESKIRNPNNGLSLFNKDEFNAFGWSRKIGQPLAEAVPLEILTPIYSEGYFDRSKKWQDGHWLLEKLLGDPSYIEKCRTYAQALLRVTKDQNNEMLKTDSVRLTGLESDRTRAKTRDEKRVDKLVDELIRTYGSEMGITFSA